MTDSLKNHIDLKQLPKHIALIMDGNGRWAKKKGAERIFGHKNAIEAVRDTAEGCAEIGVKYLTLYAFSTENWRRPQFEVSALMNLLVSTIRSETKTLMDNDIRLNAIGNIEILPKKCQRELQEAIDITKNNNKMVLTLALSYSGRWELVEAMKRIIKNGIKEEEIDEALISKFMRDPSIPDPELMIRTSGEMRISNFLLWQIAYSELYFTEVLWPDFRRNHLFEAILAFQKRERRFGQTSEQLKAI